MRFHGTLGPCTLMDAAILHIEAANPSHLHSHTRTHTHTQDILYVDIIYEHMMMNIRFFPTHTHT